MGEDPLQKQVIQPGDQADLLQGLLVVIGKEAQAGHAGIQLDVAQKALVGALHGVVELDRVFHGVDLLADAHVGHVLGIEGRGIAQHQNGQAHAAPAELYRLLHVGDGEIVRAQLPQSAADGQGAVAVGVRLDHAEKAAVRGNSVPQEPIIVAEIIQ